MQLIFIVAGGLVAAGSAPGFPVPLKNLEATFAEKPQSLPEVIDGKDTGRTGWTVMPRVREPHSLIIRTSDPVQAQSFDLTLCFLSGWPGRYPGLFKLSFTTDTQPAFSGNWQQVDPMAFTATGCELIRREDGRFSTSNSDTMVGDAILQVRIRGPVKAVTGFRIDIFPFQPSDRPGLAVSWNEYRDICLTEFRVEATRVSTTNVALGRPVKASHALWAGTSASVLTDGLPGSFDHPAQPNLSNGFYFEVDLGENRRIDHIALRSRADGYAMDRMSLVLVQLYEKDPSSGAKRVWKAMDRGDGSHPGPGEVDILRPRDGEGECQGRYLRLSSSSPVALSPQFAEVEVYARLRIHVASVKADGREIPVKDPIRVPAGTRLLTFTIDIPDALTADHLLHRWRLRGRQGDWEESSDPVIEVRNPPAGSYVFEAQARHSDGIWDESLLELPISVAAHFWQTPTFYRSSLGGLGLLGFFIARALFQRREARRQAEIRHKTALVEERGRIARDMHDEVGARLSQIVIMQEMLACQHPLSPDVEQRLQDISANTHRAVEALDQVVWAVNPLNDNLAGLADYLAHTITSYLSPLEIACRFDIPSDLPDIEIRAEVRHQLIRTFQEASQNIAKHARADMVTLTMRYEEPLLIIRLMDNGIGIPDHPEGKGRDGLANMKARLDGIGGSFKIDRGPHGGTVVECRTPLAKSTP
jgi:signal transduction histidine kinase